MKKTLLFGYLQAAVLITSAQALAATDCRTWNPDNGTPHECKPLLTLREMERGAGGQFAQSDNLYELFIVLGPNDQLTGMQYIKNRGSSYGPHDLDSGGAPRLAFIDASTADLERPGGVVMNPNHNAIKLAILPGFDDRSGGGARIDYLVDGVMNRRAYVDYELGHDAGGAWALFVPGNEAPIESLDAYTNYGIFNKVIGVRNITPEFRR